MTLHWTSIQSRCRHAKRPSEVRNLLVLLLAFFMLVTTTAFPNFREANRYYDIPGFEELSGDEELVQPYHRQSRSEITQPKKPKTFINPDAVKAYLRALNDYFIAIGRPRFG
ncbi:hypothetical protein CRM22_006261 [Opisthorchis felineus]|uniref:Neuropeptide F n=1 Tax=Opisthorchis felineus TaxID=147828 RepID=A0A4S2LM06_OPIFE|nr:hypothetical protein CRM22_006261 [Opisthorchis felineus]